MFLRYSTARESFRLGVIGCDICKDAGPKEINEQELASAPPYADHAKSERGVVRSLTGKKCDTIYPPHTIIQELSPTREKKSWTDGKAQLITMKKKKRVVTRE